MPNIKTQAIVQKLCKHHGLTDYILECGNTRYRCRKCRNEAVTKTRQKRKIELVKYFGGKCMLCGYSRFVKSLQFHHLDPSLKSFGIAEAGACRSKQELLKEAKKCLLLCGNCHTEIEHEFVWCLALSNLNLRL